MRSPRFGFARPRRFRIAPPRGGDSSPPPVDPPPEGLTALTTVKIDNQTTGALANQVYQFGLPLAGTIREPGLDEDWEPNGEIVAAAKVNGATERIVVYHGETELVTQEDRRSTDGNGDLRFTAVSCLLPASLSAFATDDLIVYKEAGAPASGPAKTAGELLGLDADVQRTVTFTDILDDSVWTANFREAAAGSETWTFGSPHCRATRFDDGPIQKTIACSMFLEDGEGNPHPHLWVQFYACAMSTDEFAANVTWYIDVVVRNGWIDTATADDHMGSVVITSGIASPVEVFAEESLAPDCSITVAAKAVSGADPGTFTINDHGRIIVDENGLRAAIYAINGDGSGCTVVEIPLEANISVNNNFASGSTGWALGTGVTVGSGIASVSGAQTAETDIIQTNAGVKERMAASTSVVLVRSAGSAQFLLGDERGDVHTTSGTKPQTFQAGAGGTFGVVFSDDFVGSVDNVNCSPRFGSRTYTSGQWKMAGYCIYYDGCLNVEEVRPYQVRHEKNFVYDSRMVVNQRWPTTFIDNATGRIAGSSSATTGMNFVDTMGSYPLPLKQSSRTWIGERYTQANEPESEHHPVEQMQALSKLEGDTGAHIAKSSIPRILATAKMWMQKDSGAFDDDIGFVINGAVNDRNSFLCSSANNCQLPGTSRAELIAGVSPHHMNTGSYIPYLLFARPFYLERLAADVFMVYRKCLSFTSLANPERPYLNTGQSRGGAWMNSILGKYAVVAPDAAGRGLTGWSKADTLDWMESANDQHHALLMDDGSGTSGASKFSPAGPSSHADGSPFWVNNGTATPVTTPSSYYFHAQWMFGYMLAVYHHLEELGVAVPAQRRLAERCADSMINLWSNALCISTHATLSTTPGHPIFGHGIFTAVGRGAGGTNLTRDDVAEAPYNGTWPDWDVIYTNLAESGSVLPGNQMRMYNGLRAVHEWGIHHDPAEFAIQLEAFADDIRTTMSGQVEAGSGVDVYFKSTADNGGAMVWNTYTRSTGYGDDN